MIRDADVARGRRHCLAVAASVALAILTGEAAAQRHLFTFRGDAAGDALGWAVAAAGDVDQDGYADVLMGAPWDDRAAIDAGSARLVSGRDGRVLYVVAGTAAGDWLGYAVTGGFDADGDGVPDFAVGAPGLGLSGTRGYVRLYSGRSGQVRFTFRGRITSAHVGFALAAAGDVDRDGRGDVLVGVPFDSGAGPNAGTAFVLSGRDGRVLHTFDGLAARDQLGWDVAGDLDVDRDGHADVLLGTRQLGARAGYALVRSGRDGSVLRGWLGVLPWGRFGSAVAAAGDMDRDGVDDVLVGSTATGLIETYSGRTGLALLQLQERSVPEHAPDFVAGAGDIDRDGTPDVVIGSPLLVPPHSGFAYVRSGRDGRLLFFLDGGQGGYEFGWSVAAAGDVNADGVPDLLVGEPRGTDGRVRGGAARVASGQPLKLTTDVHEVSLARSTAQTFRVDAGPSEGGRPYLVLGSASGTQPGLRVGTLRLPLNPDPYFTLTLFAPNSPLLVSTLGLLDASGKALARFQAIPQLPPGLAGTRVDHAFLVLDPLGARVTSNAAPLRLVR